MALGPQLKPTQTNWIKLSKESASFDKAAGARTKCTHPHSCRPARRSFPPRPKRHRPRWRRRASARCLPCLRKRALVVWKKNENWWLSPNLPKATVGSGYIQHQIYCTFKSLRTHHVRIKPLQRTFGACDKQQGSRGISRALSGCVHGMNYVLLLDFFSVAFQKLGEFFLQKKMALYTKSVASSHCLRCMKPCKFRDMLPYFDCCRNSEPSIIWNYWICPFSHGQVASFVVN